MAGAVRARPVDARALLSVSIILKPLDLRAHDGEAEGTRDGSIHPGARQRLEHTDLAHLYDPGAASFSAVSAFAAAHGLRVVESSRARHDVILEGTAQALNDAFGVQLHTYGYGNGEYRAHDEAIVLPAELRDLVEGVLGLDNVPLHQPRLATGGATQQLTPAQLEAHYNFPKADASKQRIALIQFGGGYDPADVQAFAAQCEVPLPEITDIGVAGSDGTAGANAPLSRATATAIAEAWRTATSFPEMIAKFGSDLSGFMTTMEVTMDVELSVALGGGASIDVFFAPSGADGWRRVLYAAIGEPIGGAKGPPRPLPNVISISWGDNESAFGTAMLKIINDTLLAVQRKGVLVCCASGDRGTSNIWPNKAGTECKVANVNFPASSPVVVACGGTSLAGPATALRESSWNSTVLGLTMASGGGMSGFFPRPAYQGALSMIPVPGSWLGAGNGTGFRGRWVPDVAASADFASGVPLVIGGVSLPSGGTSAATPLCAALLARLGAATGHPLAGLTSWLYAQKAGAACRDVTTGDNNVCAGTLGFYRAGPGWDACTGLGAPDGALLASALSASLPSPAPAVAG